MFDPRISRIRPGRPISAGPIRRLRDAIALAAAARPGAGVLALQSPSGRQDYKPGPGPFPALLSGSANPYSFTESYPIAGGHWATLPGGRTSSRAYELNGAKGLGTDVVTVHPVGIGDWYWFRYGVASGGAGSTPVTLPNCFCDPVPSPLAMTSLDQACNFAMYQSATLIYGPTPPEFASLNLGTSCFLSFDSFPDPLANNALFRYYLTCAYGQFELSRVYATSPYGSPFHDGILYTWQVGLLGNTCTPFALVSGSPIPGSACGNGNNPVSINGG